MTALLIIDMLEDFFTEGPLRSERKHLTSQINGLIGWARNTKIPVMWVRQEFRDDLTDAFPAMRKRDIKITIQGTPGCQILSELDRKLEDVEVVKKRYSAFYGTSLNELLTSKGIDHLILAGVNTHACIRTAAVDAYQRDYHVTIPIECISSYDREHHDVTLKYLARDIARLVSVKDLISGLPGNK